MPISWAVISAFCSRWRVITANQNPDLHQAVRVLEDESKIQFIVASDLFMTPSAKYADLLLPETSFMERWNIGETWGTASYLIL